MADLIGALIKAVTNNVAGPEYDFYPEDARRDVEALLRETPLPVILDALGHPYHSRHVGGKHTIVVDDE